MRATAVITGATDGIGREIARGLVREGITVVVGARNAARGEALRTELRRERQDAEIELLPLDVADLASVRTFAAAVAARHPTIQLLINNAGAWFNERRDTAEGHELTLATNLLGPYLLTHLLLPQLHAGKPSRIVNIVSDAAGNYDPEDLEWAVRPYQGFGAYGQAKQALRMVTWTLAHQLAGSGVVANAVSPGFVKSGFLGKVGGVLPRLIRLVASVAAVTPEKGAATPLWVALAPELSRVTGRFFKDMKEQNGRFRERAALEDLERRLEAMVGDANSVDMVGAVTNSA